MFIDVAPRKAVLAPDRTFRCRDQHSICMSLPEATIKYCIGLHFYAAPAIFCLVKRECSTELCVLRIPIMATFSQADSQFVGDVVDKT